MIKKATTLAIFFIFALPFFTQIANVQAQGTTQCQWNPSQNVCGWVDHCESGYHPHKNVDRNCAEYETPEGCNSPATAIVCSPDVSQYGGEGVFCSDNKSLKTAIGCIPLESTSAFAGFFLRWGIGIAGGVAFLLMVFAGFTIMTSTGNPERLKNGQQLLTSAIMGLITIIFSVFLLRLIGVNILQIPGLG